MQNKYSPPVAALLNIGLTYMTVLIRDWIDYERKYGLNKSHIPELIAMSVDEELYTADIDGTEVWAPVHAWRALAKLDATEAVAPLLQLMNREEAEWEQHEMFYVMIMIGVSALPELEKFVYDASHDEYARCRAIECIAEIGYSQWQDKERKGEQILTSMLEKHHSNTESINTYLIRGLAELRAVNALPLIEKVFEEKNVNLESINLAEIRERVLRPIPKSPFNN